MRTTPLAAALLVTAPLLAAGPTETTAMLEKFRAFVRGLEAKVAPMERAANLEWWEAATTGNDDAYKRQSDFQTKLETVYTDREAYALLKEVRSSGVFSDPLEKRLLERVYLAYLGRQLDPELLEKVIAASSALEQRFSTFRSKVAGKEVTDNQIEETLISSRSRDERKTSR
jgi:peptidyl-dipeptidase A